MASNFEADEDYRGMYFRKTLDQNTPDPSSNIAMSPDIIPLYKDVPDPPTLITPENWAKDLGKSIAIGEYNNVYVRGNNNAGTAQDSWVELNYAPSNLVLWPNDWADFRIPLAANPNEFRLPVSASANSLWVGNQPFQWKPPQLPDGTDHFCLVSRLNEPIPTVQFGWEDLSNWIKKPNVGWRNVNLVKADTPSWQRHFNLNIPEDAKIPPESRVMIFLEFTNMPVGISVALSCPDPRANPVINFPKTDLISPRQVMGMLSSLPAGFSSSFTVSFWNNGIVIPGGASVSIGLCYMGAQLTVEELIHMNTKLHAERVVTYRTLLNALGPVPVYNVGAIHNRWEES